MIPICAAGARYRSVTATVHLNPHCHPESSPLSGILTVISNVGKFLLDGSTDPVYLSLFPFKTRREYIPVVSSPASMLATVLKADRDRQASISKRASKSRLLDRELCFVDFLFTHLDVLRESR